MCKTMIGKAPIYANSKYFVGGTEWRLAEGAPQNLKDMFEEDMNADHLRKLYRLTYPEMENPYYTWEGKIVDKK